MKEIYRKLQQEAIRIADRYPAPDFYSDFEDDVQRSHRVFASDPNIGRLHDCVAEIIDNDFGHGLDHVRKVALDAGALTLIEGRRWEFSDAFLLHRLILAQAAGLLHDIRRKDKNHAQTSSVAAEKILSDYAFSENDIGEICLAIRNHEAFGENESSGTPAGALLSDCLYDADKFRWGPENFTHTLWCMVSFSNISLDRFMHHYPRGMAFLRKIRSTFRTRTGRTYGPQFIDIGVAIGDDLYERIRDGYAEGTQTS